jgi:predicted transcriptional regulator
MKKPLLEVVFASEKRKQVLLLLHSEAKEMEELLKALGTTRTALLPQMKILEKHYLVSHEKDIYELTNIGKLIVKEIAPLINTADALDVDIDYWGTRNLSFIPHHLLKRISVLGKCNIVTPSLTEIYDAHQEYHESCMKSKSVFAVTNFLYPDFDDRFARFIENDTTCTIVISKILFSQLKNDRHSNFEKLVRSDLIYFFIYPYEMDFFSFGYNDYHFVISPFKHDEKFDSKYLLCSGPEALEWGKELFDHYFKDSTPITEI